MWSEQQWDEGPSRKETSWKLSVFLISVPYVNICTSFLSSCLLLCLSFSCLHSLSYFSSYTPSFNFTLFLFKPFYCLRPPFFFPPVPFIHRDKAPGQRECDSSIDNINKCIRDIEQASLAAVSQNLPSRDDISLEVSNHQKMTQHFPKTTTGIFLFSFDFSCILFLSLSLAISFYFLSVL